MEQYNWKQAPLEEMGPLITRQVIHTPALTMLRGIFKRGAIIALHQHVHEQITTVVSGSLRLEVNGEATVLGPGEILRLPSEVPHQAEALEDTEVFDIFIPARTDWQ